MFLYLIWTSEFWFTDGRVPDSPGAVLRWVSGGGRFARPRSMPDAFWGLINECWVHRPARRPSFGEITRRMMSCDDFTLPGTDLREYPEYRHRMMRECSEGCLTDPAGVLTQLRSLGIDVDSIAGLHP
jgi:hypothetical protein